MFTTGYGCLNRIPKIKELLQTCEEELSELQELSLLPQLTFEEHVNKSRNVTALENKIINKTRRSAELRSYIKALKEELSELLALLECIEDKEAYDYVYYKYVKGYTQKQLERKYNKSQHWYNVQENIAVSDIDRALRPRIKEYLENWHDD